MKRSRILQILCAACVVAAATACRRSDEAQVPLLAQRMPGDALAWSVERAQTTRHLATSTLETRDAADGSQFVVLDVSVRNPDAQAQVVSEGSLVAIDASHEQQFATPVSMLADEFLTLQVLPPAASTRGRIAFEVPEGLGGALYWTPGNSTRRIRLHVERASASPRTLANAGAEADAVAARTDVPPARLTLPAAPPRAPTVTPMAPPVEAPATTQRRTSGTAGKRVVASAEPAPGARAAKAKTPRPPVTVIPAAQEEERRMHCDALLTRNAEADGALRPFYLLNCPDYPLPPAWRAAAIEPGAPTSATAAPRPAPTDCGALASTAARLVCRDPFLASLDRRLAQSLSRALEVVDDPAALRRDQDDWRARVREGCDTIRCLELAYGRRTAHIDALARTRP